MLNSYIHYAEECCWSGIGAISVYKALFWKLHFFLSDKNKTTDESGYIILFSTSPIDPIFNNPLTNSLNRHCRGRTILTRRQNVTAGCLNFAKSLFAVPDSGVACLWQNFNNLPSILPLRQNNPVAAVRPSSQNSRKFPFLNVSHTLAAAERSGSNGVNWPRIAAVSRCLGLESPMDLGFLEQSGRPTKTMTALKIIITLFRVCICGYPCRNPHEQKQGSSDFITNRLSVAAVGRCEKNMNENKDFIAFDRDLPYTVNTAGLGIHMGCREYATRGEKNCRGFEDDES